MSGSAISGIALLVIGIALFVLYTRMGKLFRCVLFTATTGLLSLGLLQLLGKLIPIGLAVTPFSTLASGLLGVPGVLGMLVLQLL